MLIVAADGQQVKPYSTDSVTIGAGQRYDVIITTKEDNSKNYAIYSRMVDQALSNTGTLRYTGPSGPSKRRSLSHGSRRTSGQGRKQYPKTSNSFFDDMKLVPADEQPLLEPVDHTITYNIHYGDDNGQKR